MMKSAVTSVIAVSLLLRIPLSKAEDNFPVKRVLTLRAAMKAATAAQVKATKRGATVVIAVVDDGEHLILLHRLGDTRAASVEVGVEKARTAAIFRRPNNEFEVQTRSGRVAALALPGATPLQGGVPITVDGKVIGAIGISGDTPQEDEDIGKVGAAVFR
jgi:uncharacterized protein GlcG (DUF336 family)